MRPQRSVVRTAVWASVYDNATVLNFNYGVGIAKITVLDETGKVVYREDLNTNETPGTFIDTEGWDGGEYTIKITYGTIKLIGIFEI
jgi:flagellar hook assembly protein FlgD